MSRKPAQKPRGDSKLDALPPEQQTLLSEWLTVENVTYAKAKKRVAEQFGISTTASALSGFYSSVAVPWKYARAAKIAENLADLEQGKFQPALRRRIEQLAFDIASSNRVDAKALKSFVKMITDGEKIELQKRTLSLALEKFRESVKSDVEKGLDALFAEIKGNAEALALFQRFKACALKSVQETKA